HTPAGGRCPFVPAPGAPAAGPAAVLSAPRSAVRAAVLPSAVVALGDPLAQRLLDVVTGARVRVHVGREVLERVAIAVDRGGAVDPAVVPVGEPRLPARRPRPLPVRFP